MPLDFQNNTINKHLNLNDNNKFLHFVERLGSAKTASKKWDIFNDEIHKLGFNGATYGLSTGLKRKDIADEVIYYTSYQSEFVDLYQKEGLADHDYAVLYCATGNAPALWTDIKGICHTKKSSILTEASHDYGLKAGLVIPFRNKNDLKVSGVGLSFHSEYDDVFQKELKQHQSYIYEICTAFDEAMRSPACIQETYQISPREMECLTLTCFGYLNKEIADQLRLSPKTVEHYMKSAMQKLRARNKHHAAAKAAILGLISP